MPKQSLTYGQLFQKLNSLGFEQRAVQLDDQRGQVFVHKTIGHVMITLPDNDPSETVEPFYMGLVLTTLKRHNLLPESPNPLLSGS